MDKEDREDHAPSLLYQGAFGSLSIFWAGYAWYLLWSGGFSKGFKHSKRVIHVDGFPAIAVAFIFMSLALVAALIAMKNRRSPACARALVAALIVLPPCAYLALKP